MKILSVRFLNLNSLKGAHFIDFSQPPFSETGLFAITGPTGAGKTTILDAITIALYGCVHRHEKDADECMTRFTGESYSEVVFEVGKKQYRAKWFNWRAYKKPNGDIQGPKMELAFADTDEIIINHPLKEVKEKIVEICGLDYDQFIRSVMLCQGDFTRFLKAKESERSELLEKITDTAIYSEISIFVYEKTKKEKADLQSLQDKIGQIEILSEEAFKSLTEQKGELQQEAAALQEAQKKTEEKLRWLSEVKLLEEKVQRQEGDVQTLLQERGERAADFAKLSLHNKAMLHKARLQEIENLQQQSSEVVQKLTAAQHGLPQLEQNLSLNEASRQEASTKHKEAETVLAATTQVLDEVIRLDAQLKAVHTVLVQAENEEGSLVAEEALKQLSIEKADRDLEVCRQRLEQLTAWLAEHTHEDKLNGELPAFFKDLDAYAELKKHVSLLQLDLATACSHQAKASADGATAKKKELLAKEKVQTLAAQIKTLQERFSELAEGALLEDWQAQKEKYPARILLLQNQQALAQKHINALQKITELTNELSELENARQTVQSALGSLRLQQADATEKLSLLEKLAEQQLLIQKYEEDRNRLEAGCSCPLCGSTEHPYIESYKICGASEAERKRNLQKDYCTQLANEVTTQSAGLVHLQGQITECNNKLSDTRRGLADDTESFAANNRQLKFSLSIEDAAGISTLVAEEKKLLDKLEEKLTSLKTIRQQIDANEKEQSKHQEALLTAEGEWQVLQEREMGFAAEVGRLHLQLEAATSSQQQQENIITGFLQSHRLIFDPSGVDGLKQELQKRVVLYSEAAGEWQKKNTLKGVLENERTNAENILADITERLTDHQQKLVSLQENFDAGKAKRKALFEEKDPVAERARMEADLLTAKKWLEDEQQKRQALLAEQIKLQTQINDAETLLAELKQKLVCSTQAFLTSLQQDGFESFEVLKAAFIDESEAGTLLAAQRRLEDNFNTAQGLLESTKKEQIVALAKKLTEEREEALLTEVQRAGEKITGLYQQVGSIQEQLDQNAERQKRFSDVADKMVQQRKEAERWERLSALIGSAEGKKFRTFAQSLTLTRLTELANRHLQAFNDRYQLVKAADKELELQIVDAWQADAVRPVTTLSGGESFLVSLSLALGLSDLAGRKTRIESLFIDEGFGTLDAETLDVAISALENLRSCGKMIGIISHVEALKERIGTQLEVRKMPGGCSKIRVKLYEKELLNL